MFLFPASVRHPNTLVISHCQKYSGGGAASACGGDRSNTTIIGFRWNMHILQTAENACQLTAHTHNYLVKNIQLLSPNS